jgi:acyl-[acyl carrier protein]--UDP-N-acetylglucosamine O-acyltransferase
MTTSIISDKAKIGKNVTIGHFCIINDDAEIADNVTIGNYTIIHKNVKVGEATKIGSYCEVEIGTQIGKNSIIQGRIRTGEHCVIEDEIDKELENIPLSIAFLKSL